jgi:hypothetical protein
MGGITDLQPPEDPDCLVVHLHRRPLVEIRVMDDEISTRVHGELCLDVLLPEELA